jgi:alpha-galactosidase
MKKDVNSEHHYMPMQLQVGSSLLGVALAALGALLALAGHSAQSAEQLATPGPYPMERFLERIGVAKRPEAVATGPVTFAGARQDWKHLTADVSCHTLTPLQIGQKRYAKGLGAHANGTASFQLHAPLVSFLADVGVDVNPDTQGRRGSVVFSVKVDGRKVLRTPVCRGGEPPRAISLSLTNATMLELVVSDAGDGISYDQADWAEARLTDAAGKVIYLSDVLRASQATGFFPQQRLPASFVYGGVPASTILAQWPREDQAPVEQNRRIVHEVTWREPGSGLAATWRVQTFRDWPAMESRWIFTNEGKTNTRVLSQVLALDLETAVPADAARLLHCSGGLDGGMSSPNLGFEMAETRLGSATLSAAGGRSSNRDLPFFLVHNDQESNGVFVGIGWSGQWQARLDAKNASRSLRLTAEMPGLAAELPPGERIISPSILIGTYEGDSSRGGNTLRRLLCQEYVPTLAGRKPLPPVSWNSWFIFENGISAALLKAQADLAGQAGVECFCIDAGWFEGDFPNGVGNWTLNRVKFPDGLGPVGEYVAAKGMKLGLWFEPERVAANTRLAREHPQWVHRDLLDLGNPEAQEWVFQMMRHFIEEGGVKWIRFDFNTDPLATWEATDIPNQRGLAQIRHIMGLYKLLDRLRQTWPELLIEGCAGGGRRIDLETVQRSHTFWKSDNTTDLPVLRFHQTGANTFLPGAFLNVNLLPANLEFDVHSLFGGPLGLRCDWSKMNAKEQQGLAVLIRQYKQVRHLLNEDYFPLFAQDRKEQNWVGWQFQAADRQEGLVVLLRPPNSAYRAADIRLQGLVESSNYRFAALGLTSGAPLIILGQQLTEGWPVELLTPGSSRVFTYTRGEKDK